MEKIFGNNIAIKGSINEKIEIIPYGNAEQETREGTNIIDFNVTQNSKVTVNDDGTLTINGTGGFALNIKKLTLKAGGDYYQKFKLLSGNITGTTSIFMSFDGSKWISSSAFVSYSPAEDTEKESIWVNASAVFENAVIQLWGNTDRSDFEQYGVSPSLDYPSEIKTVGSNFNKFNIDDITENMYLNDSGTTGNSTVTNITGYLKMEANQKYTFSYEYETLANSTSNRGYCLYDLDKNVIEGGSIYSPTAKLLTFIPEQDCYIRIAYDKNCKKIKFEQGPKSSYSEYGKGSIEIKKYNSNLVDLNVAQNQGITYNNDGTVTINRNGGVYLKFAKTMFKAGIKYYQRFELVSGKIIFKESGEETTLAFRNINDTGWITRDTFTQSILTQDTEKTGFWINAGVKFENAVIKIWIKTDKSDYVSHKNQTEILEIQEEMVKIGDIADTFVKKDNKWYEKHDIAKIDSYNGETITTEYISTTGNLTTGATVYYVLEAPNLIPCTPEQIAKMESLQNMELYEDTTNIVARSGEVSPNLEVTLKKQVEDYDFYISSTGHFIIPELDIKMLIDFSESSIPNMPEAVESSIRAAGRDGDYVLNTTYEPVNFNIVCYTDDNLTPQEKTLEEEKINYFLNSIKNKTKRMADERYGKFYNVKYNASLVSVNYPKHIKFTIPLKTSESYGKKLIQKMIFGNGTVESKTIKEAGAVFTINGPALNPIISLNDYSMEYNMSILEGARIEIDSNKSTVTHINAEGVRTNVMKYYNHQFPKIEYGKNELKVLSGIDNEFNVNVKWYDLKL